MFAGKSLAGLVTFAVTVAAFWITVIDRPPAPTFGDWQAKAGAACERNFGNAQLSLHTALLQVAPLVKAPPPAGKQDAGMTAVMHSIDQLASSFRAMSADIREIPVPSDHDRADIDALLSANQDVAGTFSMIATVLVNYQVGQVNAPELQKTTTAMQKLVTSTIPSWLGTARRLGLTPCLAIMGTELPTPAPSTVPATTAPATPAPATPSPSPTGFTEAQRALTASLSTNVLTRCDPASDEENDKIIAAVNCDAARTGPTKRPLVMRFASADALREWRTARSGGLTAKGCGNGDSSRGWTHKKVAVGTLICKPGSDDNYLAMWTFDDDNIGVIAEAGDRKTIYTWWTKNAYLLTRAIDASPTPDGFTAAQQTLVGKLKTSVLTDCDPTPKEENDNVVAAVNCDATRTGPTKRPLVMQFVSVEALKSWLATRSEGLPSTGCSTGDSARSWNNEGTRKGTLVCKPGSDDNYLTIWTFDAAAVAVIAEAGDRDTIRDWWAKNANLLTE
ncbi:hypothetical protein [Sphaerisporangium aureirubrum]|uniref:Serine/threonine protein kinase n=1 Tax=Sphaerisporangium aureirubrum TaxID=1544736 RepID=A0ABW1NT65_9ACTN